ncbi:MAG TPA: hypothetical protein VJ965_03420 [Anaerolineales bacterium]|nr:hypothetical protein [Anaerolineales bacterium]
MRLRTLFSFGLLALSASACSIGGLLNPPVPEQNPPSTNVMEPVELGDNREASDSMYLATPVFDSPAAGICGEMEGDWITMTINPDVPDPRCVVIRPDQMLEVVNHRGETLLVSIGSMQVELADGESYRFEVPFGEYLMPGGVHAVDVQPCCGGVLWFKDGEL